MVSPDIDASAWKGQRVKLNFEAVDWETTVWVNGKEVGTHKGMHDPFSFDITDAVKDGKGELVVRVWDPTDKGSQPLGKQIHNPHGIWYTPVTGIWQTVWMEPVGVTCIRSVRAKPDLEKGEVEFVVEVDGECDTVTVGKQMGDGFAVWGTARAGDTIRVKVQEPKLWTPDSPHLYPIGVFANSKKQPGIYADEVTSYFAFRTVGVGKDADGVQRLLLNGKPLFQVGPLDQGWWPDGLLTPPSDEAMKYDLEVLKKVGFNMLRKHIKVEPSRYYYHCDKLGLLVWQDMPSAISRAPGKKHFVAPGPEVGRRRSVHRRREEAVPGRTEGDD